MMKNGDFCLLPVGVEENFLNYFKVYTDWANRHLSRHSIQLTINDLTNDLRQPTVLISLLKAVTIDCVPNAVENLQESICGETDQVGVIAGCLKYLSSIGVSTTHIRASDIADGQLGAVLSLLYALSNFKQQLRQSNKSCENGRSNFFEASEAVKQKHRKTRLPNCSFTMPANSKLPPPTARATTNSPKLSTHTLSSKIATPIRIPAKENPPSPAPHSRLPLNRSSGLRVPTSRLQPPSSVRPTSLNNNAVSRSSSRSSSVASSGTYTSIPSLTSNLSATKTSNDNRNNSTNMLKIKLFSSKDKEKKAGMSAPNSTKNLKSTELSPNLSKLTKPKTSGLKAPKKVLGSPNANSSVKRLPSTTLQETGSVVSIKAKSMKLQLSSGATQRGLISTDYDEQRFSKNCNDKPPFDTLGSSSHTSSAESSSVSMNSASSKTSSLHCSDIKASTSSSKFLDTKVLPTGTPPTSPSDSKPILAVKGISAPKLPTPISPEKPNASSLIEDFAEHLVRKDEHFGDAEANDYKTAGSESLRIASTSTVTLPTVKVTTVAPSPAIGVVSPMLSHRIPRAISPQPSGTGSQSDASTTSGSRDSDNISVIYNPASESKMATNTAKDSEQPKPPPVPLRTNSHLETTFDSNCSVTTTEFNSGGQLRLEDISPMKPITTRAPPSYSEFLRKLKPEKQAAVLQRIRKTNDKYFLPDSSTSEDSLDFLSKNRYSGENFTTGYLSDGDPLPQTESNVSDLSVFDVTNGYMSEGGITVYARKMQARFREGLEAVKDGVRHRQIKFNDSFEDSSSLSSGISENFDDISTDDLTASSLSDHPMTAAAAYGKLDEYQHYVSRQLPPKRSLSANQSNNALRIHQRRLYEQENVDQLLQKCRTSQRGVACNLQSVRYVDGTQRTIYRTVDGKGHQMPQLALSDDGDTLCVRGSPTRSSLRVSSKQDHQVQAGPGFNSMAGYHSLDRKAHLLSCYRTNDENPYRFATFDADTSAATLAMVSPRRIPSRQQLSLVQNTSENRHSVAAAGMSRSVVLIGPVSVPSKTVSQPTTTDETTTAKFNRSPSASKLTARRTPFSLACHIPTSVEISSPPRSTGSSSSGRKVPVENIYANFSHRDQSLQLHKLSDDSTARNSQTKNTRYAESGYLSSASKTSPGSSAEPSGSHLSLASSSGCTCSTMEEKYEAEIRKLNQEMESYRSTISKLTAKHDGYFHLIQTFENKLNTMAKHLEVINGKSQLKKEEVSKLRAEIDSLRVISINAGAHATSNGISNSQLRSSSRAQTHDGAGELLRQPSLESVNSHRSSMSSSSKGSKTDKSSLNSFGKQGKKSWIRSSFTRAFAKNKKSKNGSVSDAEQSPLHVSGMSMTLKTISGSSNGLDEVEAAPRVVELKRQLEDKDSALTDVRLDALDKAREVDFLKETINRLKTENKILKQNYNILERRIRSESRASSQQSLPTLPDEDPVYEMPPASECLSVISHRTSISGTNTASVKVTVSVDFSGIFPAGNSAGEISIGGLPVPDHQATWQQFDAQLFRLFSEYINRIDPEGALGLHHKDSVIGYECGDFVRDVLSNSAPSPLPADVVIQNTNIRMYLKGASQRGLDGLILDCLFPRAMIDQLLSILLKNRRLVLFGATGIGKSNLARQLARYLSIRIGASAQDSIVDIKLGDDDSDRAMVQVQKQLESLLRQSKMTIILIDNIQRHRIAFLSSTFSSVDTSAKEGPYVICTVNRASQLPEMQMHHDFRMFLLPNDMNAIKGYMGRFLRRRILESEFRDSQRPSVELHRIIDFFPNVLAAVNGFIEKSNSRDVTIGSRLFLQCPLDVEKSREWFVNLWNKMIIPYMVKVAKEGVKVLGRCGSFEDPTDLVCEQWPWIEGPPAEQLLHRLSIKDSMSVQANATHFDPLEALMRIQSNSSNPQQEVA